MEKRNFNSRIEKRENLLMNSKNEMRGITLIALVITIVLNSSYLAMERMLRKMNILKIEKTSDIIQIM